VRPFSIAVARALMQQCQKFGSRTPVYMKQFGRLPTWAGKRAHLTHPKGEDMNEWPTDMRVQQFPPFLDDPELRSKLEAIP
jgi:hypothetical protein